MPMMNLRELVDRYKSLVGHFGEPVALAAFGLSAEETVKLFTAIDEDYHISRFLNFEMGQGRGYQISGNPVTHVRIEEGILALL
jgi:hypothetical protein